MEKRLARGLDALMGRPNADASAGVTPTEVAIELIRENPQQPRKEFDAEAIRELAESISQHGLLQPIVLRRLPDHGFELIAGERRLRAFRELGRKAIPAIVRQSADEDRLILALIENIQRENLGALEQAEAFARLMSDFGLTHEAVAARVGKERSTVTNTLRLLDLPFFVREAVSRGTISAGHARALLPLAGAADLESIVRKIIDEGWSVRAAEKYVRGRATRGTAPAKPQPETRIGTKQALDDDFAARLRAHWGVLVDVSTKEEGGEIRFRCSSRAELEHLLRRLEVATWRLPATERFSDFEIE